MHIDILTLFPEQFKGAFDSSIIKIAQDKDKVTINLVNWRQFATDRHQTVDDRPYGGGSGMVLKVDVLANAIENLKKQNPQQKPQIILLTPQGQPLKQKLARSLAKKDWLILICGHYEGFDERIRENLTHQEISIGDYILSGGEFAAMVVVDSVVRLLPAVLGNNSSIEEESFTGSLLEYPQYTRPENYLGWKVPDILLSGNHTEIKKWRQKKALEVTKKKRGDLLNEE